MQHIHTFTGSINEHVQQDDFHSVQNDIDLSSSLDVNYEEHTGTELTLCYLMHNSVSKYLYPCAYVCVSGIGNPLYSASTPYGNRTYVTQAWYYLRGPSWWVAYLNRGYSASPVRWVVPWGTVVKKSTRRFVCVYV